MKLYKVDTGKTFRYGILYIIAENINDCLFKVRKHMEKEQDEEDAKKDIDQIKSIELLTSHVIE